MKYKKINFAAILSILSIIAYIFSPFFAKKLFTNENLINNISNAMVISYLAYKISYMDNKNVGLVFLPLAIFPILLAIFVNNGLSPDIFSDLGTIYTKLYGIMILIGIFFIIELLINNITSALTASVIGFIFFLIYLVLLTGEYLKVLSDYKIFFLYFAIFVMALRIRSASKISPLLIILGFSLVGFEIYLKKSYEFLTYDFLFSLFPLVYLSLKTVQGQDLMTLVDYELFALIYIYPALVVVIKNLLMQNTFSTAIISLLATYIIGELIYKSKNKFISYPLLGIK